MTEIAARLARPIQRLGRPSAVALALAVLVAVAGTALLARAYSLRDSVLPGVSVAGVDVGGLSPGDAQARIQEDIGARLDTPVEITDSFVHDGVLGGQLRDPQPSVEVVEE